MAFFGLFGVEIAAYSPIIALGLAITLPPVIAIATKGKYYLRRCHDGIITARLIDGKFSSALLCCSSCKNYYERADVSLSLTDGQIICSLCETIHD